MTFSAPALFLDDDRSKNDFVPQACPAMITTQVISDAASFRDLRSEWNALLQACPSDCIFLTWEWAYTWWLHVSGKRRIHIVVVRLGSLLIALAPLALRPASLKRLMPWRVLEFLASGSVGSDYLSFLIRPGHEQIAVREIARCLDQSGRMLELVRIEKSSASMAELSRQLREAGWKSVGLTTNYCPYSILSGHTWESYFGSLHANHRINLGKMLRRLHKDFDVSLRVAASESERQWAMDVFVRLHLRRWSDKGGSTALNRKELIDFHRAFSEISLERGWLKLYTLLLDGVPVSSLYVFKYREVYYHYQSAFDPDYRKYSLGTVIIALAIKDAIEDRAVEFDFLHDNESYTYLWARQERELMRLELYPARRMGSVYRHSAAMKHWIKRLVHNCAPRQERKP
ncbi:MAG: GNAT family N-acetyltransferase [Lysobacterales bacterium]|nr:MAG: GNAT family N-acetyltransferase [Xanthomonadales bacterium]